MTDKELARAIAQGDKDASRCLIEEHYDDVYRFLSQSSLGFEDAEDLTQQTFVAAIEAAASYRGEASLRTWLHRIAVRELLGWRRKFRRLSPLRDDLAIDDGTAGRIETGHVLLDALRRLPDRHRVAFLLHEVQQFSVEEVALAMRIPQGTVKSHLHHARKRLRSLLENDTEINYIAKDVTEN